MIVIGRVARFLGELGPCVRGMVAVASVAAGLFLAAAVGSSDALASAGLNWRTGIEAKLPATTEPNVELTSVSCASVGNCAAVGRYGDALGNRQGLLLTETLGTWTTGVKATLPAGADSDPIAELESVSCASARNCSAVGQYRDTSGNTQGLLLTQKAGAWATGVAPTLPSATPTPNVAMNSVSCKSPGNCTAVGDYNDSSGNTQGLLLTESSGTWAPGVKATVPAAAANPEVFVISVSCVSAGNCTAVGVYNDSSGKRQGLLLRETSGVWAPGVKATLPAAAVNPDVILRSVVCASAGNCTAVGSYVDSFGHGQGLLLSESAGTWGTGVKATLPAGAATDPEASLESVSCTAAGNCAAVGGYTDTSSHGQGVLLTQTSGAWGSARKAVLPAGAAADPAVDLSSVSCFSAGNCAAAGEYNDNSGQQGLLLSQTGGTWATGVKASQPTNAATDPGFVMGGVSCTSVSDCTAVGRYSDKLGQVDGVFFGASKASPTLSIGAPSSGTVGTAVAASAVSASLSLGAAPIGTIRFRVFGPQPSAPSSCLTGGRIVGGTTSASGNRAYHPSTGFIPTVVGTYWWYAAYSGDPGDNAAASVCGASMAKTVVRPVPVVSSFKQTHSRWREGTALPTIASTRKTPVGTVFTFAVSQPGMAKLVFTQRNKIKGVLSMAAKAGKDKIKFQGRLSRKRRLAPGHYTVAITATNANHATSVPKKLSFTIVR